MALISGTISNLFSGVSQQAPALRLPTQAEAMDNFYPSLVDGLVKRPPMKDVARFGKPRRYWNARIHIINRDPDNVYILVMYGPDIYIFRRDGTVAFEHIESMGEETGANPHNNRFITIADHTFFLHTQHVTRTKTVAGPDLPAGTLISVKQASYDTKYAFKMTFVVNGYTYSQSGSYKTPPNFSTGDNPPPTVSTTEIAERIATMLRDNTDVVQHFTVELSGSSIYINPKNKAQTFCCTVEDSRGDTQMTVAKDRVQKFSDLPAVAVRDFTVEIVGDEQSAFDNYYVKFVPNDSTATFGPGTWEETVKPGMARTVPDDVTLPMTIVHTNGSFAFKRPTWKGREVGDENSAPDPLFIGSKISDMFLYRNRLGILSDDNLTLSAAGDFFRFYPETVTTIVDSDPISISAGHETVTKLKHAIPFQENLVVFAENAQFNMPAPDVLSPSTAALKIATTYAADLSVKPVTTGETVAFCTRNGENTGVREFYTDSDTLTRLTANITAHVASYIPSDPLCMTCSTTEDVLVVVSKKEPHKLYVYKYYWSGNEKLQAAWFTFSLSKNTQILDAAFHESTLYMVVRHGENSYLTGMDFSARHLTDDSDLTKITLHLDRQTTALQGVYDPATDRTTWIGVADLSATNRLVAVNRQTLKQVECTVSADRLSAWAAGQHTGAGYVLGVPYESTYTFSEQFLRSDDGSGNRIATQLGRLQFRRWSLIYGPSCFFKVRTEQNGTVYEYPFTGEFVNHPRSFLAKPALFKGKFSFPVKSVSDRVKITITNDTCLPCSIIGAEWEAFYTQRQRGRV